MSASKHQIALIMKVLSRPDDEPDDDDDEEGRTLPLCQTVWTFDFDCFGRFSTLGQPLHKF